MHASSSTRAAWAIMLHLIGSLSALKISVGGDSSDELPVMRFAHSPVSGPDRSDPAAVSIVELRELSYRPAGLPRTEVPDSSPRSNRCSSLPPSGRLHRGGDLLGAAHDGR